MNGCAFCKHLVQPKKPLQLIIFKIAYLAGLSKTDELRKNLVSLVIFSILIFTPISNFFNLITIGLKKISIDQLELHYQ